LTRADAQLGNNVRDGEELAISQYNATNPAVRIVVDPVDTQGKSAQANNDAIELVDQKVVAVITAALFREAAMSDRVLESAGIPNVSASATDVPLAEHGWAFFHRVLADDGAQGPGDANYLVRNLGLKSVAVIDDSSTYGEGLANAVRFTLGANGGQDVLDDHIDPRGASYASTVKKVVVSKAAAVFFGGYYDAAGRLANQLRTDGYKGVFMSGDGSEDARFISDAGVTAAAGAYLTCACADETQSAGAQVFVAAYRAAYGSAPGVYAAEAYDATNFVLAAIKSGATTPTAINNYLGVNSYTGITKTLKFLPNGNISAGTIYVYQVKNGKIVQIGTTSSPD
jgi:branched-chain amino acid transport system substrate-binding protein